MSIDDVITMLNSEDCMLAIAGMCLMRYKERDCWKCILKQYSKTVYNKAIDDFAPLMKESLNHDCATTKIYEQIIYNRLFDKCNEIEEQLKEGVLI